MQRNILKMTLLCGMTLFLIAAPPSTLHAAEDVAKNTSETTVDTDALSETYYVNAQNGLKMRSAPSKDSDVVTLLPYKAEVIVIDTENSGWYQVTCSGKTGYVAAKYITQLSEMDTDANNDAIETDEDIPLTERSPESVSTTLGATPLIFALIAAIIIMIILAIFTAYSFLKKDKDGYDEPADGDDYDEDYHYGEDEDDAEHYETNLDDNAKTYMDDEYDDEYYEEDE